MRCVAYTAALGAVALAVGLSAPASAQVGGGSFTGLRVEGLAGWDRVQNDGHKDGVAYGVGAGYDVQMGPAVVGIEGEADGSSTKQCVGSFTAADPRICAKAGRDLYVGGRVGTVLAPGTLLYAKAGYTNARVRLTGDDGTGTTTLDHRDLDGVRVGAGIEHALFSRAYVKAEYRYSNYQDHFSRNQVLGGFGVRF
ncbi:MAG: porin family protein [Sphingomonadaceae bacterium]|nr:porin family protein [Sphingomonadaceae bacterium]